MWYWKTAFSLVFLSSKSLKTYANIYNTTLVPTKLKIIIWMQETVSTCLTLQASALFQYVLLNTNVSGIGKQMSNSQIQGMV